MITMVISAVLAGCIFWRVIGKEDKVAKGLYMIAGTITGGFIGFIIALMIPALAFDSVVNRKVVTEKELVGMRDGELFLGRGINQDEYYFFYSMTSDSGYRLNKVKADHNVTIYEEKRSNSVLKEWECQKDYKALFLWKYFGIWNRYVCEESYSFHIPEGSITKDFSLTVADQKD